uniref:Uncharacterized protein n=1 Tax=Spongospora subterranea TaxID=70186 RepID=A0A0H5QP40_9EUKA|eukprot:CRZ03161.1 hypothetical protein [Spongospora subterranea]
MGDVSVVHSQRLRFYADASLNLTEELRDQIAHDGQGFVVNHLHDLRLDPLSVVLKSWFTGKVLRMRMQRGRPAEIILADVPTLAKRFLDSLAKLDDAPCFTLKRGM